MGISVQTMGVLAMVMMATVGLAVISDVAKQRSLVERMVYYQADEIAMDIEIMDDWDDGYLQKSFRKTYSMTIRNPTATESASLTGNPKILELQRREANKLAAIHSASVEMGDWEDFKIICFEKSGGMVQISKGEC
jgi:hypothetical protein